MTFFTDPYLELLAGALFALVASPAPRPPLGRPSFRYGLVVSVVVALLAAYFYVKNPEWMWMYSVRAGDPPAWLGPSLFLLYPFPYVASYLLALEFRKKGVRALRGWLVAVGAGAAAMHLLILDRWTSWVTPEAYLSGPRTGSINFWNTSLWLDLGLSLAVTLGVAGPLLLRARKLEGAATPGRAAP